MLKLNCGSGQRPFSFPFTNIDCNPKWNPDIVADAVDIPLPDASADIIVLHHCAEHMTLGNSQRCFAECHRLLAPGGSLLVFVPNLAALVSRWIEGRISDYIFCVNLHGAFMDSDADIHRWSFTQKTLKDHLRDSARWGKIKPFDWRKIPGADIAGPDWWILAMEAVK